MQPSLESAFQQRTQELLEMHQASHSDDQSSLQLHYMDLDALQQTQNSEEMEQDKLFVRICPDGRLECFQLEGWTNISLATQPAPPLEPFVGSSDLRQGSMSMRKKRKTRTHVLAPSPLDLVPFGEDETLVWTKRIFQFTGEMRRVLGDRWSSFSWGGSIVDSIIGVLLTHTVSDMLSRKAFMNIAAKFPSPGPRSEQCDIVDWNRVLVQRSISELKDCIKCRGMQDVLAERIMKWLEKIKEGDLWKWFCEEEEAKRRISDKTVSSEKPFAEVIKVLEQLQAELNPPLDPELLGYTPGKLSLEWMRRLECDSVTEILTKNLKGFGPKSAACVALLCCHWKSIPVDVNVARICARLGWIPLKTTERLEDMDEYAPPQEVHKYLKARLSHLDFFTLYELHYLMITMGKVFCTKKSPRCGACPLRNRCEYACSGGKRSTYCGGKRYEEVEVPIKKPMREKVSDAEQTIKRSLNDTRVKTNGATNTRTLKISEVTTCEPMQSEDRFVGETPKKDVRLLDRSCPMNSNVPDIEDIVPDDRKHPRDSATSIATHIQRAKRCKKRSENTSAREATRRTSTTEIARVVDILPKNQATSSEAKERMMEGSCNEGQSQVLNKHVAAQILNVDRDMSVEQEKSRYKYQSYMKSLIAESFFRHLSKLIHPHKGKEENARTTFTLLRQACQVITKTSKPGNASSSTEAAEDEETRSFVSNPRLTTRTVLTTSRSRNILRAFEFPNFSSVLRFLPSGIPNLSDSHIFLLPDPRKHDSRDIQEAGDAVWSVFAMIHAKDALEKRFPLDGFYLQTNELFLIDGSPFQIPTWCLSAYGVSSVHVYLGKGVRCMSRGMETEEVTYLFNHSYLCNQTYNFQTGQTAKLHLFLTS